MIWRPHQYNGKHDQADKLKSLNFIDLLMYLILCISSIVSMSGSLFDVKGPQLDTYESTNAMVNAVLSKVKENSTADNKADPRDYLFHIMFIGLFALNVIYVIIWLLKVFKYGWKHLSITP